VLTHEDMAINELNVYFTEEAELEPLREVANNLKHLNN